MVALAATALFVGCAGLVQLYARDPAEGGYPLCMFHYLTGLYCPGCGTARAVHRLLHGQLLAAMRMNVLAVGMLPVLLAVVGVNSIAAWRGTAIHWPRPRWAPANWRWGVVTLVIAFWLLRNVPIWPFSLLAPH